jgi:hypothetical protein
MRDIAGVRAKRETLISPDLVRKQFRKNVKEAELRFVFGNPGKKS